MKTSDFYYDLPQELIAQDPLEDRSSSRLMHLSLKDGSIEHRHFTDILDYLHKGDCLVINDTKVIPARLYGHKEETGTLIEILLLKRRENDIWECLVKPGKKARPGAKITFGDGILKGEIIDIVDEGNRLIQFHYEGIFEEILDQLGEMPLPPYITHKLKDKNRYQTVYANGGWILNDDKTETGYADPKTQEGIQCWIDMYNEGLSPSASALSETTADAMFEGGQLAMNFAGSYMVPEYASNDAIKDKVDCVEIPTFNGKEDNCINGLGYAVFEGSKNKEAAEDFAIWLGSKEAQEIQGKTGVVISARTDAQKYFAEANSQYNLAAYTNHADEAYPLPVCTKAAELYDLEATELQKAYNGEKSLSDVCKGLTKQADKLLQEK